MLRPRTTKIVAVILAIIAAVVGVCGYNFVYDKNIRPVESTLIPITEG
jgi:hypothetical protein